MPVWHSQSSRVQSVLRGVGRFVVASSSVVLASACASSKAQPPSAAESDAAGVFSGTAGQGPCESLEGARCPGPADAAVSGADGSGVASDVDAAAQDGGVTLDAPPADTNPADTAPAELAGDAMGSGEASAGLDAGAQDAGLPEATTGGPSTCQSLGIEALDCPGPGSTATAFSLSGLPLTLQAGQGYAFGVNILSTGNLFIGTAAWSIGPSTDGCTVSAPLAQWTFTGTEIMDTVCVKPQEDVTQVILTLSATIELGSARIDITYCGPCP